ncbi:MAG: hypothetical protein AAFZ18_11165 [Myxococcota bacterium]
MRRTRVPSGSCCATDGGTGDFRQMYLVQLAVEGLRGFPERISLGFRGHLDILAAADREKRTALLDVLFHTLYPDPERADATRDLVAEGAGQARSILTLSGRDKVPYRLVRNLRSGSARLFRYDHDQRRHVSLSENAREAVQFLRVEFHAPDDASFERLFIFAADGRASLGVEAKSRAGAPFLHDVAPSGPGLSADGHLAAAGLRAPSRAPSVGPTDPRLELTSTFPLPSVLEESTGLNKLPSGFSMHNALVQQEMEEQGTADLTPSSSDQDLFVVHRELVEARGKARRRAKVERNLDFIGQRQQEAEAAVEKMQVVEQRLSGLDGRLRRNAILRRLPGDFRDRLAQHETQEASYRMDRKRLDGEQDRVQRLLEAPVRPVFARPRVWGGALALLMGAAIVIGFDLPWFAVLQICGGVLVGWGLWEHLAVLEERAEAEQERQQLFTESEKVERAHKQDTLAVRTVLDKTQLSVADLGEQLVAVDQLERERSELLAQLEGKVGRRGRRAEEILEKLVERKDDMERALMRIGHGPSLESIDRRIEGVRRQMAERGLAPPDVPAQPSEPSRGERTLTGGPSYEDEDEDEDGYGNGYAGSDGSPGSGGTGLSGAAWHCIGGFGGGGSSGFGSGGHFPYGGGAGPRSRSELLIEAATDLVGTELEVLTSQSQPRAERFLQALTSRRFTQFRFVDGGRVSVLGEPGELSYDELEGSDLDQVDAALRFALLEAVLQVRRAPVIIEEPLASLPPGRRAIVRRLYAHLASLTQLLVLTPAQDLEGHVVPVEG